VGREKTFLRQKVGIREQHDATARGSYTGITRGGPAAVAAGQMPDVGAFGPHLPQILGGAVVRA